MNSKKPGITLLELILKLLIITTLSGIAIFMFTKDNKEFNESEVRAALQSDGQNIQERISDIGIEASGIEMVFPDKESGEIDYIIIKSYKEENGFPIYFRIQKSGKNLIIAKDISTSFSNSSNNEVISGNVDKLSILKNTSNKSINFNIYLKKSNYFIYSINYEVNLNIYFKN